MRPALPLVASPATSPASAPALLATDLFHPDLLAKYDISGPRYTSYPTAPQFHERFGAPDYAQAATRSNAGGRDLSLYLHIPFCDTVCFYCGCNKIITRNRARSHPYLARLHREISLQAALFDTRRPVRQLHWGGGTPTFLSHREMTELMAVTADHFTLLPDDQGEYSIEIDPREAGPDTIALLRQLGFNRLSLGVQDFDERVQRAVNRIQPHAITETAIRAARDHGFKSVSVDLIYGLPHQSVDSFSRTLDQIIALSPDRLSVFNYAHMPQLFKMQRRIDASALPSSSEKLAILQTVIDRLTRAGYTYIGMDHFARPDDELAQAQANGTLYRNFQGYSTHADCDLIGLGVSAIGKVDNVYAQNAKDMSAYETALDSGRLPISRGVTLTPDDEIRRDVISRLMCHFELPFAELDSAHGIQACNYFATELDALRDMERDGLIALDGTRFRILPAGRLLIRNIAMTFDRYLGMQPLQRFSRTL